MPTPLLKLNRLEAPPAPNHPVANEAAPYRINPYVMVFAISLGLRWVFAFFWGSLLLPDSIARYLPISDGLFDHWRGTVFDTPGYPGFLKLAQVFFFSGHKLVYLQGLLDSLTVVMIFDLAKRLGLNKHAWKIAGFFSIHFGAIVFTSAVLSETLFTFLVMASVWWFGRCHHKTHILHWITPGLLLGFAALTRANGIAVTLAFACCLLLSRWSRPSWQHLALLIATAALPIGLWVQFNARTSGVKGIAQGGGWQWMQNIAYFDLLDPQTLPTPFDANYKDWTSLGNMRAALMAQTSDDPQTVDPLFSRIAKQNALAGPAAYMLRIPSAWLLPRRFIKDITRRVLTSGKSGGPNTIVPSSYSHWLGNKRSKPRWLAIFYECTRSLTIIPGKYTLLITSLPILLWFAWRRKDALLFLMTVIPLAQALPLFLLLNPIERYYFPFESLMIMALIKGISIWRDPISHPSSNHPEAGT